MPKPSPNEPWLHQASGYWCKKVRGRLHYLDKDYRAAKRQLAAIWRDEKRREYGGAWLDGTFAELCDDYLEDVMARKSPDTYTGYRYRLLRGLKHLPAQLRICEFRRHHLTKIEQALTGTVSPTSIRDTLATFQFVFNWAVKNDLLETNPVSGYIKPRARSRNRIITPCEFQCLLRSLDRNAPFRRVLIALRRTGCRPKEVRTLTWEMVDLDNGFWILPEHKTINTQRQPQPRIIPLPPCIWKLCRWLYQRRKPGCNFVFLNAIGKALKTIRAQMIDDDLSRRYINDNINRIRRCFRWATEEELIPGDVYQALRAVPSLAVGRTAARETEPIRPVDLKTIERTLRFLSDTVADMVRSQLLLAPCFVSKRTGRGYTTNAYRLAIIRACSKADIAKWTPNQLRHTKATEVRAKFGLEAAQVFLGHGSADVTQIYAERNLVLAQEVARAVG